MYPLQPPNLGDNAANNNGAISKPSNPLASSAQGAATSAGGQKRPLTNPGNEPSSAAAAAAAAHPSHFEQESLRSSSRWVPSQCPQLLRLWFGLHVSESTGECWQGKIKEPLCLQLLKSMLRNRSCWRLLSQCSHTRAVCINSSM